ncbi:hypothetical protein [Spiroplasma diminutum]|uniref:Uncharacterized protein n=1 Tax=Spiroplasma diminutum CUAS-1 TaxID=1276221 RepID=S5LVI3_9MOLU|nr:hypothetical protein [Spiroplasma diminutum]AGR41819.1 hypothetical protein SDIMI_v3c01150 [Spiroplasma diminutum CUAS-1]
MVNTSIFIALGIAMLYLFMFYTSGLIITELFKFRIKNYFVAIATGFFSYFTFISVATFPLQLISVLPYVFFVYYIFAISIIYLIFCFTFTRFWLNTNFFKIDSLIFIMVVGIFVVIDYASIEYITNENFSRHKNTLAILYWLKDNPVSFFNDSTLFNFLGFKPFQGWYTFQLSTIIMVDAQPYQYRDLIIPLLIILDAFLITSILFIFYESFSINEKIWTRIRIFILSLLVFIITRVIFWYFNYSIFGGEMILIYLIMYATTMLLRYTSSNIRERFNPIFVGIVLGGYISFSWDSSYQILFLVYAFVFAIQRKFNQNFTKDVLQIAIFPLIGFIFYNIILNLYLQAIIFGGILLLMFLTSYLMNKRYSFVAKFELFLESRSIFTILLVPIFFMTLSTAFILAFNENVLSEKYNSLNILYLWLSIIKNNIARQFLTFVLSMFLLAGSFVWIFFRKRIKCSAFSNIVDLFLISYLTFYNPISVRFISVFYPKMFETNGIVLIVLLLTTLNTIPYSFSRKRTDQLLNETVVIKKYSRINF